ncbi:MAG: RsmB/NOP family class I SAM-dependent RNA methyltransferase [Hydrogenophilus sp.]|nr:RsmB/NOP family class I SAM-dependent RNA methyltransferase [Hydrogenophilus sp.]
MPGSASFPEPLRSLAERLHHLARALALSSSETEALFAAFTSPAPLAGRVNPLRGVTALTDPLLLSLPLTPAFSPPYPHPLAALAFLADPLHRALLTHSPAAEAGQILLQSLSSQWAVWILDPRPGETILDLAAAPGGKTALIAAAMGNRGQILAVEAVKSRFYQMRGLLDRLGVTNARLLLTDGRRIAARTSVAFSKILLDAPCSSEARIHLSDSRTWRHWSLDKIHQAAYKQRALLSAAWRVLAPGGRLLYVTCTYAPEENEWVVAQLLAADPSANLIPPPWSPPHARPALLPDAIPPLLSPRRPPSLSPDRALQLTHARRLLPIPPYTALFLAFLEKR